MLALFRQDFGTLVARALRAENPELSSEKTRFDNAVRARLSELFDCQDIESRKSYYVKAGFTEEDADVGSENVRARQMIGLHSEPGRGDNIFALVSIL